MDADTEFLDLGAQDTAAAFVELLVHQVPGGMHDVDGETLSAQPVRGLQAEQTAADHHRGHVVAGLRHLQHAVGVGDVPESEHPTGQAPVVLPQPVHVGEERVASRGDDEHVVVDDAAALTRDRLREPVECDRAVAGVEFDAVGGVPAWG